jgi:hypothetical protein
LYGAPTEANMPGDPKECRTHALNCMLLAKQATNEESKRTFTNLARSWTTLAVELEQAQSLLHALSEIDFILPWRGRLIAA